VEYRRLGRSGLKVSALSFGSWVTFGSQVDDKLARELLATAYDAGVSFFDNAEVYAAGESERIMGRALNKLGWGRDTFTVSSKVYWGDKLPTQRGLSRKHVHDACHAALERLQVDYLDLFFCHRPDLETPIEETVRAMNVLIEQGKVLYWGTSEHTAEQLHAANTAAREWFAYPPRVEQPQLSLIARHKYHTDVQPAANELGMGLVTWSPLASGLLTGKYDDGLPEGARLWRSENLRKSYLTDDNKKRVREFKAIADELGVTRAQLSIAWCLAQTGVTSVITGATRLEQLQANLEALKIKITDEVAKKIDAVFPPDLGKTA
jgi:voltage-dependent potassium channel beta subunit